MIKCQHVLVLLFAMISGCLSLYAIESADLAESLGNLSSQLDLFSKETEGLLTGKKGHSTLESLQVSAGLVANEEYDATIKNAERLKAERESAKISLPYKKTAVIVVDVQYDFVENSLSGIVAGALAVKNTGDEYIKAVNTFIHTLREQGCLIVFTQEWHPQEHVSFKSRWDKFDPSAIKTDDKGEYITNRYIKSTKHIQRLWVDHCVQNTTRARLAVRFVIGEDLRVRKGMRLNFDSYSGFQDADGQATAMKDALMILGIENLIIIGIATDSGVKVTALDALAAGYQVYVVTNLCQGEPLDAFTELSVSNAHLVRLTNFAPNVVTTQLGTSILAWNMDNIVNQIKLYQAFLGGYLT